jgi:hypothetical protein
MGNIFGGSGLPPGFSQETWEKMAEDKRVTSADDVPDEIKGFTANQLMPYGNSMMMHKMAAGGQSQWFYAFTSDSDPDGWKKLLSLPIGEQADLADLPSKYGPWTDDNFLSQEIPQDTSMWEKVNMTALANLASATLIAQARDIRAQEWTSLYQFALTALKKKWEEK